MAEQTLAERGARAIYARRMTHPRSPAEYKEMMADARAVIWALRVPTKDMILAALAECDNHGLADMDGTRCMVLFGAMIDAALAEGDSGESVHVTADA